MRALDSCTYSTQLISCSSAAFYGLRTQVRQCVLVRKCNSAICCNAKAVSYFFTCFAIECGYAASREGVLIDKNNFQAQDQHFVH